MRLVKGEIPPHNPRPNPSLSPEARARLRFVCKRPRTWRQKDPMPVLPLEFAPILRDIAGMLEAPAVVWVPCSPQWLAAGGDCANAPRRVSPDPNYSHLHPED